MATLHGCLGRFVQEERVCAALGVRLIATVEICEIARRAGYEALFIDLEHSCLDIHSVGQICRVANNVGVLPFVRVPAECGNGFIQRLLEPGAAGVIVPHVRDADDVLNAVKHTKYPPLGHRSIHPSLLLDHDKHSVEDAASILKSKEVTLMVMIETQQSIENLDSIASVPGLDVLQVGSMDISMELDILGQWDDPKYLQILQKVSAAARRYGKQWGISGLANRPDLWQFAVHNLGARFIVGAYDTNLLTAAAKKNALELRHSGKTKEKL